MSEGTFSHVTAFFSVADIETDDFEFLFIDKGTLITHDVNFTITGNVTLESATKRRYFGYGCHFHGMGCAIHTAGSLFTHINPFHGFTHACHARFGYGHNHHHPAYLYSAHPHHPRHPSVSLNYHKHSLNLHVSANGHHFNVHTPFNPKPNVPYHVMTSYRLVC